MATEEALGRSDTTMDKELGRLAGSWGKGNLVDEASAIKRLIDAGGSRAPLGAVKELSGIERFWALPRRHNMGRFKPATGA